MNKSDLLKETVKHIDIKKFDAADIINAMRDMSFTSRDTAVATDILEMMIAEQNCTNILTLAGSTSAAGCMQIYVEMIRNKMTDDKKRKSHRGDAEVAMANALCATRNP